jgi:hypothetical protein
MKMNQLLMTAGVALALCFGGGKVLAQGGPGGGLVGGGRGGRGGRGGGNFDPAQMEQMRLDNYRQELEVTDNAEWNVLSPLIKKVMDAEAQARAGGGRRGGMRGMRGGNNGQQDTNNPDLANQGGGRRGGGRFSATPNPEAEALQRAIDAKASSAELKAALGRYVESRRAKRAALEQAQENLRKMLTVRQEAIASLNGLL